MGDISYDDFSGQTETWLDDHAPFGWLTYPLGGADHIWVHRPQNYGAGVGGWFTSKYFGSTSIMGSSKSKNLARMKIECKILESYGWISCGFSEAYLDSNYLIETGFDLILDGSDLYFRHIHNGVVSGYLGGNTYSGGLITVEFLHNYDTELFEYIKCDAAGVDLTNVAGSTNPGTWLQVNMSEQSGSTDKTQIHRYEVEGYSKSNPYTSHVRWQKTIWGMRPCY